MARTPKTAEAPAPVAEEPKKQPRFKFKKDDPVKRANSSYLFPGVVVSAYRTLAGEPRYVVECTAKAAAGLQHIFNGDQLEKIV